MSISCFIIFLSLIELYLSKNVDNYLTQNLTSHLMSNYDKNSKAPGQVNISMQISIKQIVGIQEKDQTITMSVWITQLWNDPRLAFNASQFNNLPYTSVPSDKIWM